MQGIGRNVTPPTNTIANAGMRTGRSTATVLIRRKCYSLALSDVLVELLCNRGQRISCKVTPVENTLKQVEAGSSKVLCSVKCKDYRLYHGNTPSRNIA